jgi:predicted unusual protein kinase regulating ubiquinone biosynthesis (AarF/ABC1/UbiB family)
VPSASNDPGAPPDARSTRARYRRILRFAGRQLAVTWWYELFLPRIGLARVAARTRPRRMRHFAQRFHALAVELGGLMIKVGQFMSSRLDVLPPEITTELEGLQDEVPPVPFAGIRALAEKELGVPLERAFATVDETPVAAASLGQAHRATLTPPTRPTPGSNRSSSKCSAPASGRSWMSILRPCAGWVVG